MRKPKRKPSRIPVTLRILFVLLIIALILWILGQLADLHGHIDGLARLIHEQQTVITNQHEIITQLQAELQAHGDRISHVERITINGVPLRETAPVTPQAPTPAPKLQDISGLAPSPAILAVIVTGLTVLRNAVISGLSFGF